MNQDARAIKSVLISIDIEEVHDNLDSLLDACFTTEERMELHTRHVRSTAGRLALKRAVLHLLSDRQSCLPTEKDIVLGRLPNGRPVLVTMPDPPKNLFLSVSHTRSTAHGLAVLQEEYNAD
jgi:phosphopantetheinyl transferase (holo-ACP synthase)